MNEDSRYLLLYKYLQTINEVEVVLSFHDIETIVKRDLPTSARTNKDWWSNRRSGLQASAWMEAGYKITSIDIQNEKVVFTKQRVGYEVQRKGDEIIWDDEAIRALRAYLNLNQTDFAEVLGVRQQTVSEWEKSVYRPTRATGKALTRLAKDKSFI